MSSTSTTKARLHLLTVSVPLAVLALVFGGFVGQAGASVASTIIERCGQHQPLGGFPTSAYAQALRELPTVVAEYSPCEELIRDAEDAAASGSQTLGTAAIAPPTPGEQQALTNSARKSPAPIKLGSQTALPGVLHVNIASVLNSLPAPLLALVALLVAAGVAMGAASLPAGIVTRLGLWRRRRR
jgi:hypothetical protein